MLNTCVEICQVPLTVFRLHSIAHSCVLMCLSYFDHTATQIWGIMLDCTENSYYRMCLSAFSSLAVSHKHTQLFSVAHTAFRLYQIPFSSSQPLLYIFTSTYTHEQTKDRSRASFQNHRHKAAGGMSASWWRYYSKAYSLQVHSKLMLLDGWVSLLNIYSQECHTAVWLLFMKIWQRFPTGAQLVPTPSWCWDIQMWEMKSSDWWQVVVCFSCLICAHTHTLESV